MIIEARGDVIKLRGALVENQWPAIKSSVSLLLNQHPQGVIIDAGGLTEISDAGARTFSDASTFIQSQNARIVVAGMPDRILEDIKDLPGIRSQLVLASTVEEARSSLESGGVGMVRQKKAKPFVLVPLIGAWEKAVEHAATEASAMHAEIYLLYILQIPRNLALGVPMPDMETESQHTLDDAERALRRSKIPVRKLTTRARSLCEGIVKFAADNNPELLVVAYTKDDITREEGRKVSSALLSEAACDTAVYCVAEQT